MRSIFYITLLALSSCSSCAHLAPNIPVVKHIRNHIAYDDLNRQEKKLTEEIMVKAINSNRMEYYFKKLELLLDTVTNDPEVTKKLNKAVIKRSVAESKKKRRAIAKKSKKDLEEYMSREELYEQREDLNWLKYHPKLNGPYFYISHNSYEDILVHIRVKLHGNYSMFEKIILFEDAIEKHLHVSGFSVNLVFVGSAGNDVFEVSTNPSEWVTSHNWSGSYKALAHELMHLMGLPDEYDKIEMHANNKNMSRVQRLLQFREQMGYKILKDAKNGIMYNHYNKPLERHVCSAVELGSACVRARNKAFHSESEEK